MITNKSDIYNIQWMDIVFEGRNKAYGAYELRQLHERNVLIAIFYTLLFFAALASVPTLIKHITGRAAIITTKPEIPEVIVLQKTIPLNLIKVPQTIFLIPAAPARASVLITPPVIKPDDPTNDQFPPVSDQGADKPFSNTGATGETTIGGGVGIPNDKPAETVNNEPFLSVSEMPEFPGGEAERMRFIQQNMVYPPLAKENGIQGTVYVQLVVNKDGEITDTKILHTIGGGCDEEALRVIKLMPHWKSGKNNGYPVSVQFNMPFKFTLK